MSLPGGSYVHRRVLSWATASPWVVIRGCAVVALLLASPCLAGGWVADDFFHQLMLRPSPGVLGLAHRPLDLFRFASGDPRAAEQLMVEGVFPWWADPHAVLAFFRPLSSFSHWLDYQLWPSSPAMMHAHSLVWFALLLGVVGVLYRRFAVSTGVATLSLVLFAVDDAHAPVVGWIANRNQLIALTLALPALLLHHRLRRERFRAGAWLGPLLVALGLCASEAALIAGAYLVAYAAVLDRGSRLERYGSLWPYACVVLLWRVAYHALGYGASGSGIYVDPAQAPLAFVTIVLERLPVLALSQLALPWAELWEVYPLTVPWLRGAVALLAWLVIGGFVVLLRPVWRESESARFWSFGALLALIPVCASFPHDRLLLGAGIGAMGAVAELLARAFRRRETTQGRLTLVTVAALHLALAPLLLPLRAAAVGDFNRVLDQGNRSLPMGPEVSGKCVVLVNPPLDPFAAYLSVYRQARGEPRWGQLLSLNSGVTELSIAGVDRNSLKVRAEAGFLSSATQLMLRDPKHPPRRGEIIEVGAAAIQITESTSDGRPREILVRFRESISSGRLLFFEWRGHGYVPFVPPAVGKSVTVRALDLADALFG